MFSELKFPVPWGHVAVKAWGPSEGHPVLCLHGWLDNANTFDKLIPLLPRDCYYVAMDFSGHGLSSHRPAGSPYHFLDYVSDVRRVAAALQWRRFTLMGHSMGGAVAGMFCFLYPEMVDKLILLENLGFLLAPEDTEAWLKSKRMVIDRLLSLEAKQQTPKAHSPEAALQRLLEANRHLTAEGGAILLQRGATETPAAESRVLYGGAVRETPAEDSRPRSHHYSKRWTLGTAQARQQKSLCERPTGGVRVYPQRAHPASRGAWKSFCAPE
ncbi:serine hydrolase-like protein 2 isoform X2 [Gavia stellata]|uniref:serine hydrolase-like protein 2 isoform X2 n=1 Tax=Gavia stellata TaxID=37040 RepID=UPI00289A8091|nr:serine hydrolase-like protein 2 isoform X2 [Gavia stellata]